MESLARWNALLPVGRVVLSVSTNLPNPKFKKESIQCEYFVVDSHQLLFCFTSSGMIDQESTTPHTEETTLSHMKHEERS
jgi:hypothetical protein